MNPRYVPMHLLILLTLLLLSPIVPAAVIGQDLTSEEDHILKTIHASIGWAKNKDFTLLYSVIANDSAYLEVSPGRKITRGFEKLRQNEKFWASPDFKAVRYEIEDLVINLARSGDVAWFYCVLDDLNEWKGEPAHDIVLMILDGVDPRSCSVQNPSR